MASLLIGAAKVNLTIAMIESFFATFRAELTTLECFATRHGAKLAIFDHD
jgi:hypothetical protein